jgi:hypothetical protein
LLGVSDAVPVLGLCRARWEAERAEVVRALATADRDAAIRDIIDELIGAAVPRRGDKPTRSQAAKKRRRAASRQRVTARATAEEEKQLEGGGGGDSRHRYRAAQA